MFLDGSRDGNLSGFPGNLGGKGKAEQLHHLPECDPGRTQEIKVFCAHGLHRDCQDSQGYVRYCVTSPRNKTAGKC